jgi:hypothetical protein
MGVFLHPCTVDNVINIVSVSHAVARVVIRLLYPESLVIPILLKRKLLGDSHSKNQFFRTFKANTSTADDNIAHPGRFPDLRLASSQRTNAVKWIWRETIIPYEPI